MAIHAQVETHWNFAIHLDATDWSSQQKAEEQNKK